MSVLRMGVPWVRESVLVVGEDVFVWVSSVSRIKQRGRAAAQHKPPNP